MILRAKQKNEMVRRSGVLELVATLGVSSSAAACPKLTVAWAPAFTQVNRSSYPGSRSGLEDGIVVRRSDGAFTMLTAEPYQAPYAVAMQLGVFRSSNGLDWHRERTLRVSTGELGTGSIHAAHWGAILTKNTANNTWLLSYVGYKAAASNASGFLANYQGTIFSRYATEPGDAGLDSDFGEAAAATAGSGPPAYDSDRVLLAPDDFPPFPPGNATWPSSAWPHQCQGLQGTDSFAPCVAAPLALP